MDFAGGCNRIKLTERNNSSMKFSYSFLVWVPDSILNDFAHHPPQPSISSEKSEQVMGSLGLRASQANSKPGFVVEMSKIFS